jgi:CRP-like cAMP-binding protein
MVTCLQKIEFLTDVSEWKLHLLANLFRYQTVEAGVLVFEEGDRGSHMYIVSQGTVKISAKNEEGVDVEFATLKEGDYFGEIALINDMPRTATVTAVTRCLLLVLGVDDFRNFLIVVPDLKNGFEEVVKKRTAQQFKKFNVPFFASFPEERYTQLGNLCETKCFEEGTVVFSEGDIGDAFYLTVFGELYVLKENARIATIHKGRYFGEVALVTDQPRTATLVCVTRCVLLAITKERFQHFFAESPEAYADFSIKLSRHDVPLKSVLDHLCGQKYFRGHLEAEYSLENLDFWNEAGDFEVLPQEELLARAEEMCNQYINVSSVRQVNISSNQQKLVLQRVQNETVDNQLFLEARIEILQLMSRDSFKRFKASARFTALLEEIGSYDDAKAPRQVEELDVEDPG